MNVFTEGHRLQQNPMRSLSSKFSRMNRLNSHLMCSCLLNVSICCKVTFENIDFSYSPQYAFVSNLGYSILIFSTSRCSA